MISLNHSIFNRPIPMGRARPRGSRVIPIGSVLTVLLLILIFRQDLHATWVLLGREEGFRLFLERVGPIGPAVLFLVLMAQVIVAAIPGHAFMILGGYLYGFLTAFLVVHASTVLASQLAYGLAKRFGRPLVRKLASQELVDTWTERAERQGLVFFLFSFILPIFPSDVMNFVAGLSGISGRKFFAANFFGRLPTSILFTSLGAFGLGLPPWLVIAAGVVTVMAFAVWKKLEPRLESSPEVFI